MTGSINKLLFRFYYSAAVFLILFSVPAFADTRTLSWSELTAGNDKSFDDPFTELTRQQLNDLSTVARIRWLIANDKSSPDGVSAEEEKRLVKSLSRQGIDVERLLSLREKVAEMRRKKMESGAEDIDGKIIRIPGYMIPVTAEQTPANGFLLVPWVPPCSHLPHPPPNQVIYVSVPDEITSRGQMDPVWVEGTLHRKPAVYKPFLVDGNKTIGAMFALEVITVSDYSAKESEVLAQGTKAGLDPDQSWYQNMQMRVTILFTQAMTAIRDRNSSGPVWFGLLIAFAYGVLHTLGPGHGKAVVVSYFAGNGGSLGRGIRMGVIIAVCHVLSAVVVVVSISFIIKKATGHAPADFRIVRLISYGAIGVIGASMLWRVLSEMRPPKKTVSLCTITEHVHDHTEHHHGCSACSSLSTDEHSPMGWLALAAGAVPCTGAILVLLFGLSHDLLIPAVLMVAAISLGMAVSMSGIGILAILGRRFADQKVVKNDLMRVRFNRSLRIAGASLILLIGLSLFTITVSGGTRLLL